MITLPHRRKHFRDGGVLPTGSILYLPSNTFDGDTNIIDKSPVGRSVDTNNNVAHDTAQAKFGASSIKFLHSNNGYILYADSADFWVGADDFTVSTWFKRGNTGVFHWLFAQSNSTATATTRSIESVILNSDIVQANFWYSGGSVSLTTETTYGSSNWHYMKFTRVGNTLYLIIDGLIKDTGDVTGLTAINSSNKFALGQLGERVGTSSFTGWFDDFLYTNGTGDSSLDVPTGPRLPY